MPAYTNSDLYLQLYALAGLNTGCSAKANLSHRVCILLHGGCHCSSALPGIASKLTVVTELYLIPLFVFLPAM